MNAKAESLAATSPKGRRSSARGKLIEAAYTVMSKTGLDGSTIAELIEAAGVGVGSFYKHFKSKEDLAKAVFAEKGEELGTALEQVALHSSNIAGATCYAFRRFIEEVETDPVWAAFIVQLEPSLQMLDGLLRDHARSAIGVGIKSGELKIENIETGITAFHAVMIAIARSMLDSSITHDDAHRSSVYVMRMFGIADEEALRLSRLSMEALRMELTLPQ